jgi:hypothetical protein
MMGRYDNKFWEELDPGPPICCWEELIVHDTGRTEKDASNNYSGVTCVFIATGTCLSSPCLPTIRGDSHTQEESLYFFQNDERWTASVV